MRQVARKIILTPKTVAEYRKRSGKLLADFEADRKKTWNEAPLEVAAWFAEKALLSGWCKGTWYLNRSALLWFMSRNGPVEATAKIRDTAVDLPARGDSTSSLKQRRCPPQALEDLFSILERSNKPNDSNIDRVILRWLKAGLAAGLRPAEWADAEMRGCALIVKNAKVNAVRGNGETRTIVFDPAANAEDIRNIHAFMRDIRAWISGQGKPFEDFYAKCRKRLTHICRKLLPVSRRGLAISLYSMRHQFAADMKASGLRKNQIAALMGHGSEDSAIRHYAKRGFGTARTPPRCPDEEVVKVRLGKKAMEFNRRQRSDG